MTREAAIIYKHKRRQTKMIITTTTLNEILSAKAQKKLEEVIAEENCASLSPKHTAKIIRIVLKENWQLHKFSVKSDRYGIWVNWTDGPTEQQVAEILDVFGGRLFDAMTDSTDFQYIPFTQSNGETVKVCFYGFSPIYRRDIGEWTEKRLKAKISKIVGEEFQLANEYAFDFIDGELLPFASDCNTTRGFTIYAKMFEQTDLYSSKSKSI